MDAWWNAHTSSSEGDTSGRIDLHAPLWEASLDSTDYRLHEQHNKHFDDDPTNIRKRTLGIDSETECLDAIRNYSSELDYQSCDVKRLKLSSLSNHSTGIHESTIDSTMVSTDMNAAPRIPSTKACPCCSQWIICQEPHDFCVHVSNCFIHRGGAWILEESRDEGEEVETVQSIIQQLEPGVRHTMMQALYHFAKGMNTNATNDIEIDSSFPGDEDEQRMIDVLFARPTESTTMQLPHTNSQVPGGGAWHELKPTTTPNLGYLLDQPSLQSAPSFLDLEAALLQLEHTQTLGHDAADLRSPL